MWGDAGDADLSLWTLLGRVVDGRELVLLWDHAHLNILLMLCSNLLLLLL